MTCRLIFAAAALLAGIAGTAQAASTPSCAASGVVNSVVSRFDHYSHRYIGYPMTITAVEDIHERRIERMEKQYPVERRYCGASVVTSDGVRRKLWYLIERNFGFAGLGSSVEYCVSGLDRWHVHGAACKSLR